MIGSYSAFCDYMGYKSKSYVAKLKQQNRLVFVGDKIDFEKSKAKILATNDIARLNITDRAPRSSEQNIDEQTSGANKQAREQYDIARAMKEAFAAKQKKLEYEQLVGKLGSLDEIQKIGYDIGKVFKTRLATFAIRAAPVVTKEQSEKTNREFLLNEMDKVIQDVICEFEKIRNSAN